MENDSRWNDARLPAWLDRQPGWQPEFFQGIWCQVAEKNRIVKDLDAGGVIIL